jgi:hypothetical protein
MKNRIYTLLIALLMLGIKANAQKISPQSINSNGTKMTQSNGSLSFTLGEIVLLNDLNTQSNSLRSGFTAGATLTTQSIQEPNINFLDIKVYPNPTSDLLNIRINHSSIQQFVISITDLQGKEVYNGTYSGIANTIGINTSSFSNGSYILSLSDNNQQILGTYKIIKE